MSSDKRGEIEQLEQDVAVEAIDQGEVVAQSEQPATGESGPFLATDFGTAGTVGVDYVFAVAQISSETYRGTTIKVPRYHVMRLDSENVPFFAWRNAQRYECETLEAAAEIARIMNRPLALDQVVLFVESAARRTRKSYAIWPRRELPTVTPTDLVNGTKRSQLAAEAAALFAQLILNQPPPPKKKWVYWMASKDDVKRGLFETDDQVLQRVDEEYTVDSLGTVPSGLRDQINALIDMCNQQLGFANEKAAYAFVKSAYLAAEDRRIALERAAREQAEMARQRADEIRGCPGDLSPKDVLVGSDERYEPVSANPVVVRHKSLGTLWMWNEGDAGSWEEVEPVQRVVYRKKSRE